MNPPKFLFLSINEVCNLHCQHCEYWRAKRTPQITTERQLELIREFAELGPGGTVVICGGEPMLDVAAYYAVCATSREVGLRTLSVVNGTQVRNEAEAERVVTQGPDEVSVSLDSPDPEVHDLIRGVPGSHAEAVRALKLLLRARGKSPSPRVYAMGLLSRSTYLRLSDFYHLVLREIGADKLKLNAIQPTFVHVRVGQEVKEDHFFAEESQVDPTVLENELLRCSVEYDLRLNPVWIDQVTSYFRQLWQAPDLERGWVCGVDTTSHICNSADRSIMVDLDGKASLCFSMAFRHQQLSAPGDMRRFWEEAADVREAMQKCDRLCGISHSVRNSSATRRPT